MQTKTRRLTARQKDSLTRAIIEHYERDPISVEKAFPEVARILQSTDPGLVKQSDRGRSILTEMEKQKRLHSLQKILHGMNGKAARTKEQAIQALEDIAALVEASSWEEPTPVTKDQIAILIKAATGLSLRTKGKTQKVTIIEGNPVREVFLLRGVKLGLTWDKKLLSVELDPKELAIREKLLSIVGIGSDNATDVSARHDEYFVEAIWEHMQSSRRKDLDIKA